MNVEKYKNPLPYPERPIKPIAPNPVYKASDTKEYVEKCKSFAKAVETHEADILKYKESRVIYQQKTAELHEQFKQDLFEYLGISNNPKKDLLFSKAWEYGHSCGLYEVYLHAEDLVDLIL